MQGWGRKRTICYCWWRKVDNIPNAPKQSYVNSVYLSQHDINVIYVAFNHHKYGDFKPYIFKSTDKGSTWNSISNNLPEKGSVYSIEEDHVDSNQIITDNIPTISIVIWSKNLICCEI